MINIATLRREMAEFLESDALFTSQINALLGEPLNFYLGAKVNTTDKELPAITLHILDSHDQESENRMYQIIAHVQIAGDTEYQTENNIKSYNEEETLAQIAVYLDSRIRQSMPCMTVDNVTDMYIENSSYAVAPLTESMLDENGDVNTVIPEMGYLLTYSADIAQIKFLNS